MPFLALSRRAALDLEEIYRFSVEQFGKTAADNYFHGIEEALQRLRSNPGLLRLKQEASRHFKFYRIQKHFLVCALIGENVYVLTVKHASLDLPSRLAELEPHLLLEAELLHTKFLAKRKKN